MKKGYASTQQHCCDVQNRTNKAEASCTTFFVRFRRITGISCAMLLLSSCGAVVTKDGPSISHVHIGHAITAWPSTPNQRGLLVTAELDSIKAAAKSNLIMTAAKSGDLEKTKESMRSLAETIDPSLLDPSRTEEYGLRRAAAEAIVHLDASYQIYDASPNVQKSLAAINIKAQDIVERVDELLAFISAGLKAEEAGELSIIAGEVSTLVAQITGGPELKDTYGLYDWRQDIDGMIAREDPPYRTVENRYLFNLLKLPSKK